MNEVLQHRRKGVLVALFVVAAIVLGSLAGGQVFGISRDYVNYVDFFELVRASDGFLDLETRFEPGFTALVYLLVGGGLENAWVYGAVAALCVFVKVSAFRSSELSPRLLLLLAFFYLSRYFILFEMTVLRAAVAFSIAFLVFWRKEAEGFRRQEVLLLMLAVAFHYSAVVFLFIYLLGRLSAVGAILLACVMFLVGLLAKSVLFLWFESIFPVFSSYQDVDVSVTIVPVPYMLDIVLVAFALLFWRESDLSMRYSIIGLLIGVAIHFSMLGLPIISGRFRELLSIFILVYVLRASMAESSVIRTFSVGFALLSGMLNFYAMTVHDPLLSS